MSGALESTMRFILRWESGLTEARAGAGTVQELFERARRTGYSDDPADLGGATQCGVTIGTYRAYCRRKGLAPPTRRALRDIPFSHWSEIFRTSYWDRWRGDMIADRRLAMILVDWVWGSGVHGIREPQRLLGVRVDGVVGSETITALNTVDGERFAEVLIKARLDFVEAIVRRNPTQRRFLNGWRRRINDLRQQR